MKEKILTFDKLVTTTLAGVALCTGNHTSAQLPNPEEDPKLELEVPAAEQKESEDDPDEYAVSDFIFDVIIEMELDGVAEDLRVEMLEELAELFGVDFATLAGLASSLGFDLNEIDLAEELAGFGDDSNLFPDSSQAEGGNEDLGGIGLGGGILDPMNLPSALGGPQSGIPTTGFASSASVTKTLFGPNNEGVQITKIFENEDGNTVINTEVNHPNGLTESIHVHTEGTDFRITQIKRSDGSSEERVVNGNREYVTIYDAPNNNYRETRWYRNGRLITTQPTPSSWYYNSPTHMPREEESSSALADWLFGRINVGKHTPAVAGANVPTHVNPANGDVIKDAPSLFGGAIDPGSFVGNPDPNAAPKSSAAPNERVAEGLRDQIYPTNGGGLTPGPKPGTPESGK